MHFIIDHFIVDKVKLSDRHRGTLTSVLLTAILDALGLGLVMPVLPTLLERVGVTGSAVPLHVGLLTALYAVMQLLCAPLLGKLSDRYGRRRILLVSLAGATVDNLFMALAPNLWIFYLARAVAGLTGATGAVAATVIADITPPSQRAARYGLLSACYGGGMIAGPVLGGLLGAASPHLPFLAAAVLTAGTFLLASTLLRETRPDRGQGGAESVLPGRSGAVCPGEQSSSPARATLRVVPGMTLLLVAFGLVQFIGQAPGSTWVLFTGHRFHWDPVEVGVSLSVFGAVQALVQALLTGRVVARCGEVGAVVAGIVADAVGLLCLAVITEGWAVLPVLAALGLGGITDPALQSMLTGRTPEQCQGRLQGVLAGIESFTSVVGPVSFTTLFALTRSGADGTLWFVAAGLYLPCTVLIIRVAKSGGGLRHQR